MSRNCKCSVCKGRPTPCDCAAATALAGVSDPAALMACFREMLAALETSVKWGSQPYPLPLPDLIARAQKAVGR